MQSWSKFTKDFKMYFKTNYKDWKWWYKLVAFLLGLIGLLTALISGLVNIQSEMYYDFVTKTEVPKWAIEGANGKIWDYDANLIMYFSYFTNQTNFFVLIWFGMILVHPKKEGKGKYLGYKGSIIIATYISVTAIIWTFMLLPAAIIDGSPRPAGEWFSNVLLHLIVPIMMVVYVVMFMHKTETMQPIAWLKKSWMIMIYPVIYGIVMLLRGEARYQSGFNGPSSYPYFFLELHETLAGVPGWVWFIIALVLIIGIAIGFSTLYVWSINYYRDKMMHKESKPSSGSNDGPSSSSTPTNNPEQNSTNEVEPTPGSTNPA